jgi:hypothetical protein
MRKRISIMGCVLAELPVDKVAWLFYRIKMSLMKVKNLKE